jgi:serine/threonine-protein kinase CTR1
VVAVKQLVDDNDEGDSFGELRREALLMHQLRHPNLVTLIGVMLNPPALVMEYMQLGDLYNYLHSPEQEQLPWSLRINLALDIALGLTFLHSQKPQIVHRGASDCWIIPDTASADLYIALLQI